MKKIIETQRAPGAIGPYVQGVDLGSMVFTSGQIPVCPQTGEIPADVQDQARLSLENVKAIVVAAGLSVGDIIKMTVFITDLNDFATINEVYKQFFDEHQATYPTRSCVRSVSLWTIWAVGLLPCLTDASVFSLSAFSPIASSEPFSVSFSSPGTISA